MNLVIMHDDMKLSKVEGEKIKEYDIDLENNVDTWQGVKVGTDVIFVFS